jgi:gamma-F420-2:alpha-L-glutamate ligase
MKVGVYLNIKSDGEDDFGNSFLDTVRSHPKVTEFHKLLLSELELCVSQGEAVFKFKDIVVTRENFDLIIIRGGFKDVATSVQFVKYCLNAGIKVFDNNLHKVRYFINKKADILNFSSANLPIPKTYIFSDLNQIDSNELEFPLIMKGINSSQGKKIFKVNSKADILQIVNEVGGKLSDYLIQELVDYTHDIRLIVIGDRVLGAMQRIPQEGEFRANFSLGGSVVKYDAPEDMKDIAIKTAKSCELLVSGVDILIDKNGKYYVLEANRSPGLKGISEALGINVADKLFDFILEHESLK